MVSQRSRSGLTDAGFVELVRDALLHLYDEAHLQTHPLAAGLGATRPGSSRGSTLRRALLDAIEALHPVAGVMPSSPAWRAYRALELRYIDGHDTADVMAAVALSKAQYHREHGRALQAVASLLRERWGGAAPPAGDASASHELTRREAERVAHPEGASVDPRDVLGGVRDLLRPLAEQRGVELRLGGDARLPPVSADRVGMRQALMAVLAHAIRASGPGPIDVVTTARGRRVELVVSGGGAAEPETLRAGVEKARIFAEALRGEVAWQSPGAGWSIALRFPCGTRPLLLVVDNNADFANLVERYLVGHGWEVLGVPDVERLGLLVAQRRPRAILLDIVMPGRDGWDVLLELKGGEATRDVPVLICSVLDEPDVATSLGAAGYLRKPVDQPQLLAALAGFG